MADAPTERRPRTPLPRPTDGKLPVDRLLSHTLPLDQINVGFDRLASGEAVRQAVIFP